MGLENLGGSSSGGTLGHDESTRWGTILVLPLVGVGLDHGSHEDIIGVTVESWGDDSLVGSIDDTILLWGENFAGVIIGITIAVSKLDGRYTEEGDYGKGEFHFKLLSIILFNGIILNNLK
jgi:hypothetical protein